MRKLTQVRPPSIKQGASDKQRIHKLRMTVQQLATTVNALVERNEVLEGQVKSLWKANSDHYQQHHLLDW